MQYHLEAEYESGFVLIEDERDHSPYDAGRNIFHAILNQRPEQAHGKLVRLSLVGTDHTYSIDWTQVPASGRPIRVKHMEADLTLDGPSETRLTKIVFGYQYNDTDGKNVQVVEEIS